jgi:radical SAM protein with 4Fe4S-binding SPASM domain
VRLLKLQTELPLEIKPTCAPQFMRIARQHKLENRFKRGCLAGIAYCIIGTQGEVYPCPYMDLTVGNIREEPFEEIWAHNEVLQRLRSQKYQGYCGICAYRRLCGGCRARAFEQTAGDYLAADPSCRYKEEEEQRIAPLAERLVVRLQSGLPLVPRPYQALAAELGVSEREVFRAMRWLRSTGVIRRLGAMFDAQQLGYCSTLCAARVPEEQLERVTAVVNACSGVTHNYLREHDYNLWFTLTAPDRQELDGLLGQIRRQSGVEILSLPAEEIYKLAVTFPEEELHGVFTAGIGCHPSVAG